PLHAARLEVAFVAEVVLVQHVAVEDVGHRLEAAMRMRRKAGDVVARVLRGKLVEHQERVQARELRLAEAAAQLHAGAVGGGDGADKAAYGAGGHGQPYMRAESPRFKAATISLADRGGVEKHAVDLGI